MSDIDVDDEIELMADPGQAVCMVALPKEEVVVEEEELLEGELDEEAAAGEGEVEGEDGEEEE